jgi:DNA polymerase III epsilon subunit-like protein
MRADWVAFDTETTGVEAGSRLVELGAIAFAGDGTVLGEFGSLVNPEMPMPPDAQAVNGLDDAALAGAPCAGEVLREFLEWLPPHARLVAHYAPFDQNVLGWEMDRAEIEWPGHRVVDSRLLARVLGETADNRLRTIVAHHGWRADSPGHRALPDAEMVRRLVLHARGRGLERRCPELFAGRPFSATARCPHRLPRKLRVLPDAIAGGEPLAIVYTDRWGSTTARRVTPFGFAEIAGTLRWHGWCHLRGARRTFLGVRVATVGAVG